MFVLRAYLFNLNKKKDKIIYNKYLDKIIP